MSKLIIQVPEKLLNCLEEIQKLQDKAKAFIEDDNAEFLILPSDGGWAITVDGEGKMNSVVIKFEEEK